MTSPDSITQIAALGLEPVYSAREAAVLLGRSYSWLESAGAGRPIHKPGRQCLAATANAGRVQTLSPVDAPGHRTLLLPT